MTGLAGRGLLAGAGIIAGVVGTASGITSLVSYPALLAAGLPALAATVANNVALVACWPGSALASRQELQGRGRWLCRWAWAAMAGGTGGAVLLLRTPERDFARIVPFLVAVGSLALLAQPWISARRGDGAGGTPALLAGVLAVSAYNGYFGAGAGVLTLGLLLVTADGHLVRANALKNMLIGASSLVSALAFIIAGPVDWSAVAPLGAGMLAGSMIGPAWHGASRPGYCAGSPRSWACSWQPGSGWTPPDRPCGRARRVRPASPADAAGAAGMRRSPAVRTPERPCGQSEP